jgi:hypothetical protein
MFSGSELYYSTLGLRGQFHCFDDRAISDSSFRLFGIVGVIECYLITRNWRCSREEVAGKDRLWSIVSMRVRLIKANSGYRLRRGSSALILRGESTRL